MILSARLKKSGLSGMVCCPVRGSVERSIPVDIVICERVSADPFGVRGAVALLACFLPRFLKHDVAELDCFCAFDGHGLSPRDIWLGTVSIRAIRGLVTGLAAECCHSC